MNVLDINDDWLTVESLGHEFSLSALKFLEKFEGKNRQHRSKFSRTDLHW